MVFRPYTHPLNWYQHEITGSIELLNSYVRDVEQQIAKGIADYKSNAKKIIVDEQFGAESGRIVEVHNGLDDGTWDLSEIFEVYFPNLQRRSALITLYSFFENELDKLCERLRKYDELNVKVTDMADTGVKRSATYLAKVVGIDSNQQSHIWSEIQDIRRIRNLVVHSDGRLFDAAGNRKKKEEEIAAKAPLLSGTGEVLLKEGYLVYVLNRIDQYFKLIEKSINTHYGNPTSSS